MLHEVIALVIGFNSHLMTIFGYPVLILTVLGGGIGRTLRGRPVWYWLGFVAWMTLCIPFSSWHGGSFKTVTDFLMVCFPIIFVIAGLVVTWQECRQMILVIALGAMVNILTAKFFNAANEARLTLETGSIGNANDYVAHLLFVLPFVLFVLVTAKRNWLMRLICLVTIFYGLYLASTAASRGGLVAFAVMCCFMLTKASPAQRFGTLVTIPVLVGVTFLLLPTSTKVRYATLFSDQANDQGALDSTKARTYLLKTSIQFTLDHPIFGVGPGEFLDSEGTAARQRGQHGNWQVPHNSYTQVSSEEGIPALFFFVASTVSAYVVLKKVYSATRSDPGTSAIASAAFCVQISLIGFSCAILFLSLVYTFYLPLLSGFAIAIQNIARNEPTTEAKVAQAAVLV